MNETTKQDEALDSSGSRHDRMVMCECSNWARTGPDDGGDHHHVRCPKYATEKYPRLFYYEDGVDAWIPWIDEYPFMDMMIEHGDSLDLEFKRADMTDKEMNELPDAG